MLHKAAQSSKICRLRCHQTTEAKTTCSVAAQELSVFEPGQRLRARILAVDPAAKTVALSLQKHLVAFSLNAALPPVRCHARVLLHAFCTVFKAKLLGSMPNTTWSSALRRNCTRQLHVALLPPHTL